MSKFVSVDKLLYFKQKLESLFTLKTNAIQTAIDNEILARKNADNALDAELTDIRVGYDGTIYDSAGNAVRTQVSELKSDLSNKITKFYASNQGETHIADSDNGKIQDMMIYGKSSQDGTPTPDTPVEIKSVVNPVVNLFDKNLFNHESLVEGGSCTFSNDEIKVIDVNKLANITVPLSIKAGNNINLSYYVKGVKEQSFIVGLNYTNGNKQGIAISINANEFVYNSKTINLSEDLEGIFFGGSGGLGNGTIIKKLQIEIGSQSTEYEPYKEQSATLPYTLNAIPVSSGGNITIDGQQYIADYVDIDKKQLVRNVGVKDLSSYSTVIANNNNLYYIKFSNYGKGGQLATTYKSYLGNIKDNGIANNTLSDYECALRYDKDGSDDRLYIKSPVEPDLTGLILYYPLVTPTIINLTDDEVQSFKSLTTYYPNTNISVNSEQLCGYTTFNYPISMQNGWNYVKQQLNDNRDYIYDMDTQSAEAYVNSEYAVALTELEV